MRKILATILLGLLISSLALAGKYRQPGYITNAYFCNNVKRSQGFIQPDRVFNKLKAGDSELSARIVLNLIVDKGVHKLEIDILDKNGDLIDGLKFDQVQAASDNWTYTATGRFGGALPEGGVFFKVFDRHNGDKRVTLGTFRVLTASW